MPKKIICLVLIVALCSVLLISCNNNTELQNSATPEQDSSTESNESNTSNKDVNTVTRDMISFDDDDYYNEWESQNPNFIKLNGTSASIDGTGAEIDGGKITITTAGIYAISGSLENGQIIVDVEDKGIVRLVLNEVEISCLDSAAIYVKNAGKTIISLQDGTQNIINDGEEYTLEDTETDEPNAAIFSKDDLTINGTGTLTVNANYNNAITSKDDLRITGGNINIDSVDDGIIGRDMLAISDGNFNIVAGGDGIKSTNDSDSSKGFVAIENGNLDIKSGADAIQAVTSVMIIDGEFTIISGGGSANSTKKVNDMRMPWGRQENNTVNENDETESQSEKGIKSSSDIEITGGVFSIDSSDDAIHSNNCITISDADISISSGDDGIHADSSIVIEGDKINISKSYEGIESCLISILDGDISIISSDDAINVAGGNDNSAMNGRPGQNHFNSSGDNKLEINGGNIVVNASGDGLDANGSIYMTNGTVTVSGPTNNGNGALDYDGVFEITGGTIISAGSAGMTQSPSSESTQYSVSMFYSNVQQAGTEIELKDGKGNTIITYSPEKQYQSVVISSPKLSKDTEYTLYSEGTKIVSFTISDTVTYLSESGVTSDMSSNHGRPNNPEFGGEPRQPRQRPYEE